MWRSLSLLRSPLVGVPVALTLACGDAQTTASSAPPAPAGMVRLTDAQVQAADLETATLSSRTLRQTVRVPGSVGSPDTAQATVGSLVEGRVVRVLVLPGDRVRLGQPLVEINSHELTDALAELRAAEAELQYRSEAAKRAETLYEAGAISLEELQRRRSDLEAASAERERASEFVGHLHPSSRGNATAIAPRDGVVFSVEVRSGQVVLPGAPLVEMGSTEVLWVTAFVPESSSPSLEPGDEVSVEFRSAPGAATVAHLVRRSEFVDPANRSVEMRFELESIPEGVRPGSFAAVDIASAESFEGVELTEDAAVRMGEEDVVFVVEEPGLFRAVPVRVTQLRPGRVAVEGLPDGAEIVTRGAYFLKSSMEAGSEAETGEPS
jgi:cobalt-zinc-cadmium efflux system membrane fusion protein